MCGMSGCSRRPARAAGLLVVLALALALALPVTTAPAGAAAPGSVPPAAAQEQPGEPGRPLPAGGEPLPGPLPGAATSRPLGLPVVLAVLACGGVASLLVRVLLAEPGARRPRC
jgi:hypothetical protein